MKKTIEEVRNYLLANRVDEYGDLMLSGLDFSDFDGNVFIESMKVKGSLLQSYHIVQGNLFQHEHEVKGNLSQSYHEVGGNLYQYSQEVKGNLYQYNHEVQGNLSHGNSKYGGELIEYPYSELLKEITLEELEELGYKLKKEGEI